MIPCIFSLSRWAKTQSASNKGNRSEKNTRQATPDEIEMLKIDKNDRKSREETYVNTIANIDDKEAFLEINQDIVDIDKDIETDTKILNV